MKIRSLFSLTTAAALLAAIATAPALADSVGPSVTQSNANSTVGSGPAGGAQSAAINGNAGAGSSGNIGLNATGGSNNQQANSIILETNPNAASGGGLNGGLSTSQSLNNVGQPAGGTVSGNNTSTLGDPTGGPLPQGGQSPAGNFGANVSAGDFNEQSNVLVLSQKAAQVGASANSGQTITGGGVTDMTGSAYTSTINSNVGQGLAGNGGFNSAAGEKNLQSNQALLFATGNAANSTTASESYNQTIGSDTVHLHGGTYTATIGGSALSGGNGNLGANNVAGASNEQVNQLIFIQSPTNVSSHSMSSSFSNSGSHDSSGATFSASSTGAGSGGTGNTHINNMAGADAQQHNQFIYSDPSGSPVTQDITLGYSGANASVTNTGFQSTMDGNGANSTGDLEFNQQAGSNQQHNEFLTINGSVGAVSQTMTKTIDRSNATLSAGPQTFADTSGNTAQNATGNVAINNAAGLQNVQANTLLLLQSPGNATSITQTMTDSITNSSANLNTNGTTLISGIGGLVAAGASGNVGINNAAGLQNIQDNASVIAKGSAPSTTQNFTPNIGPGTFATVIPTARSSGGYDLSSAIDGQPAQGASGNIGFNGAAGVQNVQANGLVIVSGNNTAASGTPSIAQNNPLTPPTPPTPTIDQAGFDVSGTMVSAINSSRSQSASGLLGFNSAAGAQNVQSNTLALYNGSTNANPGAAQAYTQTTNVATTPLPSQTTTTYTSRMQNGYGEAYVTGYSGSLDTGVVGFNSAAGVQNVQANAAAVYTSGTSGSPSTSIQAQQTVNGQTGNSVLLSNDNPLLATIEQNAFSGSGTTGDLGANAAAGVGNQQLGLLTVLGTGATDGNNAVSSAGQTVSGLHVTTSGDNLEANMGVQNRRGDPVNPFQGARGVMSANTASGAYNQQTNVLTVSSGNLGDIAPRVNDQNSGSSVLSSTTTATSAIGGNAFQNAGGVIGANSAAGAANQQVNNVVVRP